MAALSFINIESLPIRVAFAVAWFIKLLASSVIATVGTALVPPTVIP